MNLIKSPLRNDSETIACLVCKKTFIKSGRRLYCSNRCKLIAHRLKNNQVQITSEQHALSKEKQKQSLTVYESSE